MPGAGRLYQIRGGAYFLHTNEEWHVKNDGEWDSRTRDSFDLMTHDDAQAWVLEGHVEIFGNVFPESPKAAQEEKPSATIYVRVPQSLKERIDSEAKEAEVSINAWAMRCVERCLRSDKIADALARAHYISSSITSIKDG